MAPERERSAREEEVPEPAGQGRHAVILERPLVESLVLQPVYLVRAEVLQEEPEQRVLEQVLARAVDEPWKAHALQRVPHHQGVHVRRMGGGARRACPPGRGAITARPPRRSRGACRDPRARPRGEGAASMWPEERQEARCEPGSHGEHADRSGRRSPPRSARTARESRPRSGPGPRGWIASCARSSTRTYSAS